MVLLYAIYTALVHKPLVKVLAERRSKTEGAVEKARADIAAAEARTAEYEQRLREARMAVFKNQEALRQQALQARAAALAEARNKAQAQVEQARQPSRKIKLRRKPACRRKAVSWPPKSSELFCGPPRRRLRQVVADESSASSKKSANRAQAEVPAAFSRCHIPAVELVRLGRAGGHAATRPPRNDPSAIERLFRTDLARPATGERNVVRPLARTINLSSSTLPRSCGWPKLPGWIWNTRTCSACC